ncbi:MAG: COQ9 family protein [Janthinobacterium lividum]
MTPERSPERDAAIEAMLPYVEDLGWTVRALTEAAGPNADLLFAGPVDMVEAYCDLADRWMTEDAAALDLSALRVPGRVRAVIAARLARNEPYKEAVRRALGVLGLPGRGVVAARCTGRTVSAVWYAAGDASADFSWYTKRAILAGVYGSTLLYWLRDFSPGSADTLAFLDRRLAGVGRFGKLRARLGRSLRSA